MKSKNITINLGWPTGAYTNSNSSTQKYLISSLIPLKIEIKVKDRDKLEISLCPKCVDFREGEKPEYPEKNPRSTRRKTLDAQGRGSQLT